MPRRHPTSHVIAKLTIFCRNPKNYSDFLDYNPKNYDVFLD